MALELLLVALVVAAVLGLVALTSRRSQDRARERQEAELAPVRALAFEDVTALGEELRVLDTDLAGRDLDAGARADYQRALDAYEAAKTAGDALTRPEDVTHVTEILDDGRHAVSCVRARVAGAPLPTRRAPCFFDPRHGPSTEDVAWAPAGGTRRDVPACDLDAERVRAGAEPDVRTVVAGSRRVPYWQGGPAYQPYAAGYWGATMVPVLFTGMMLGGALGGLEGGWGGGDPGGGDLGGDVGGGDLGGDLGGGDLGGGW